MNHCFENFIQQEYLLSGSKNDLLHNNCRKIFKTNFLRENKDSFFAKIFFKKLTLL